MAGAATATHGRCEPAPICKRNPIQERQTDLDRINNGRRVASGKGAFGVWTCRHLKVHVCRRNAIAGAALLWLAMLAGCARVEEGFEYYTDASIRPLGGGFVWGKVTMGYGINNRNFRMRIALHGLRPDTRYRLRLLDARSCEPGALAAAQRIDARRDDPQRIAAAWGFEAEPVELTGNVLGNVETEFRLSVPTAPSIYGWEPTYYPAVVIDAVPGEGSGTGALRAVACGAVTGIPTNHRPHM